MWGEEIGKGFRKLEVGYLLRRASWIILANSNCSAKKSDTSRNHSPSTTMTQSNHALASCDYPPHPIPLPSLSIQSFFCFGGDNFPKWPSLLRISSVRHYAPPLIGSSYPSPRRLRPRRPAGPAAGGRGGLEEAPKERAKHRFSNGSTAKRRFKT